MTSYEVVLDNSKLLANCFDEAPLESFTIDLPAWHVNQGGTGDLDVVSTPDTTSEMILGARLGAAYFAETDQGAYVPATNIYMPETPSGYVLVQATYVVIAYRTANDGSAATSYAAAGYNPTPTTVPFLFCESSGVTDNTPYSAFVFNDLPVGSYAGETECSAPEILSRITGAPGAQVPANRLWNEDFRPGLGVGTASIHVAYFAVRLYYDPA